MGLDAARRLSRRHVGNTPGSSRGGRRHDLPDVQLNNTGGLFGNLGSFSFGNNTTRTALDQKYTSFSAHANKLFGDHNVKFGWNFLRTRVDGVESQILNLQLFATVA